MSNDLSKWCAGGDKSLVKLQTLCNESLSGQYWSEKSSSNSAIKVPNSLTGIALPWCAASSLYYNHTTARSLKQSSAIWIWLWTPCTPLTSKCNKHWSLQAQNSVSLNPESNAGSKFCSGNGCSNPGGSKGTWDLWDLPSPDPRGSRITTWAGSYCSSTRLKLTLRLHSSYPVPWPTLAVRILTQPMIKSILRLVLHTSNRRTYHWEPIQSLT